MGPSMNLKALQAGDLAGINGHNMRDAGHTSASIDPALTHLNARLDWDMPYWTPPTVQPDTGRKIRTDARVAASFVMTLPEELDHDRLDDWLGASCKWLESLPGKTAYSVLHMDEPGARPHIHAIQIPVNEAGNLNYKRDFGGHRERLDQMHESYALALEPLGVFMSHEDDRKKRRSARKEPEEPEPEQRRARRRPKTRPPVTPRVDLEADLKTARNQVQHQIEQQRLLSVALEETKKRAQTAEDERDEAREKAAELPRVTEELNAEKEENHRLSGSLNANRQIDSRKDLTREHEKQQASEAEKARIKEEKTAYNLLETARDNVIAERDTVIIERDTAITDRGTAEQERDDMELDFNDAFEAWGLWQKDAEEKAKQRDQAQGMMRTLARFVIAIVRGFSPKNWPAREVESIANQKPDRWFEDKFFKSVGEKLNNLVDMFDTSQKTIPAPGRARAPTKALDDDEQEQ